MAYNSMGTPGFVRQRYHRLLNYGEIMLEVADFEYEKALKAVSLIAYNLTSLSRVLPSSCAQPVGSSFIAPSLPAILA